MIPLLLERAVAVAAGIATFANDRRYSVGLLANSSFPAPTARLRVPAGRAPDHLTRLLEALAMVVPFTILPAEDLIERERRRFPLGVSLAVVAGYMTPGLAAYLERARQDGLAVALYWVGDEPPGVALRSVVMHNLSAQLREFEHAEPLAYGGETASGQRLVRRAI